jgi:hypothetical protein
MHSCEREETPLCAQELQRRLKDVVAVNDQRRTLSDGSRSRRSVVKPVRKNCAVALAEQSSPAVAIEQAAVVAGLNVRAMHTSLQE